MKRRYVVSAGARTSPAEQARLLVERAAGAETRHDLACVGRSLRISDLPPPERERVERAIGARAEELRA